MFLSGRAECTEFRFVPSDACHFLSCLEQTTEIQPAVSPRSFVCDVAGFNPVRVQKGLSIFGFIFKQNLTSQLAITFIPPPVKVL